MNKTIEQMEKIYDGFNKEFYDGELPDVVFTVEECKKGNAMGYVIKYPCWENVETGELHYQLTITSNFVDVPMERFAEIILHEMAHIYNNINYGDGEDCSKNGKKHLDLFKETAESHGLEVGAFDKKAGYGFTELSENALVFLNEMEPVEGYGTYKYTPIVDEEKEKVQKTKYKYACTCGNKFTITTEVQEVVCNCGQKMSVEVVTPE